MACSFFNYKRGLLTISLLAKWGDTPTRISWGIFVIFEKSDEPDSDFGSLGRLFWQHPRSVVGLEISEASTVVSFKNPILQS